MNDIIYNLLLAVITALGVAFVRYALPWLKKQAEKAEIKRPVSFRQTL